MVGEAVQFIFDLCRVLCYWFLGFLSFFLPTRQKNVSNELILITGSGSGIGRLLAFKFAELGATIVLWDINKSANDAVADEINSKTPNKAYPYQCDCSKREEIYRIAERVRKDVGEVTMLINNAGIVTGKKFFDLSDDKIELTFQVNSISHFWVIINLLICDHVLFTPCIDHQSISPSYDEEKSWSYCYYIINSWLIWCKWTS